MSKPQNYNAVVVSRLPRERLISALVASIGDHRAYSLQTDWVGHVRINQRISEGRLRWGIFVAVLLLFHWFFFWSDGDRVSQVDLLFDAMPTGTRVRISGYASPELVRHLDAVLEAEGGQQLDENPAIGQLRVVESGAGHRVLESTEPARNEPLPEEASVPADRALTACVQCNCQDFAAGHSVTICVCGHAATSHTLVCIPDRPLPTQGWAAVGLDAGRLLVVGGEHDGSPTSVCTVFESASNRWRELEAAPLPVRGGTLVATGGGTVCLVGAAGLDDQMAPPLLFSLDDNRWEELPSPRQPRLHAAICARRDGKIWMVGGQGTDGSVTGACELLDRAAGGWQTRQEMPTARARASAIVLPDGTLLVAGGHDGHSFLSIAETLSLEGGWQQVADMPVPMASAAAAVWREQLVELVGGTNAADPIGTTTDVGFLLGDGRWTLTQLRSGMVPLRFGRRPVPGVKSLWMVR